MLHVISLIHAGPLVASLDVARLKEQFVKIAIVTDSTCDWALDEFARRNVEMVPLKICFSNESFADQIEISTDEFYDRMIDAVDLPSTSQPSPHDFAKLFERLAEEGYEGAVCLHIALPLSGTPQVAGIAGADAPLDVRVIDTRCATAPLGLMVDAACELRDSGASLDDMCEKLVAFRDATCTVLVPDSLDNLVRGGRFPEEAAKPGQRVEHAYDAHVQRGRRQGWRYRQVEGHERSHQRHRRVHRKLCRRTRPHPPSLGALPQPKGGRNFDRHAN